jgi:hypothetical protein
MTYTLAQNGFLTRDADGAIIPPDPRNADYQKFQVWTAAGNQPNPIPTPPPATATPNNSASETL